MTPYKQYVQIRKDNLAEIMELPCLSYIDKNPNLWTGYHYHLYPGLMYDYDGNLPHEHIKNIAHEGDWLCRDNDNLWHIVPDKDFTAPAEMNLPGCIRDIENGLPFLVSSSSGIYLDPGNSEESKQLIEVIKKRLCHDSRPAKES